MTTSHTPTSPVSAAPPLSVVIPVLDGGSFLVDQLRALAGQVGAPAFEVVIADNGSTDGSPAEARAFADRGGAPFDLRVIDASERRGQTFARNAGAAAARAETLLFLDQDDVVDDGYVAAMANAMTRHPLVAARMDPVRLNPGWRAEVRSLAQATALPTDPAPWAYGCTLGVRRSVFDALGGFDTGLYVSAEDVDFCTRAADSGIVLTFVPDAVLHYRFPDTAWKLFRQGRRYGFGQAVVDRKHDRSTTSILRWSRMTAGALRRLSSLDRGRRGAGAFLLGRRLGWVDGWVRIRFASVVRRGRADATDPHAGTTAR